MSYSLRMGKLISTSEAAKILLVSPARIRQIISSGRLASKKVGRDHVIEVTDLEAYRSEPKEKTGRPKKILARAKETGKINS
jgi:excisionase family DNA binding protein